jgi:7-carboxy-7-deazaguanine synthase
MAGGECAVSNYPIAEIFHSLQGEGHFVGTPMTFVRLAGCSVVRCHIRAECDEAPWKATTRLSAPEIVDACKAQRATGIVCISGGEPTDHDLLPLVSALRDAGYRVHLETSGCRSVAGVPFDWITVSPKVLDAGGLVQRQGHTLKIVVRPEWTDDIHAWDIIKSLDSGTDFFHRYLQPMTAPDGSTNVAQVVRLLHDMHNGGARWALSTQAHRTWGVR